MHPSAEPIPVLTDPSDSEPEDISAHTPASHGKYKWAVVAMLWFICFLNNGDRQAIFSIFPKLRQQFGFDTVALGLIGSAFMWVYAFASPVAGYLGDRLRRKNLILGGCIFWSIIAAATGFCSKLWQFVLARALEGFGETFYFPASMSLISDYHGPATRSKAMSLHQSSVYIGSIAGTWFTALIAEHCGWRLGFYLFGAAGITLALILFAFLREPMRHRAREVATAFDADGSQSLSPAQALAAVFHTPAAWMLMLAFLGANFVSTIFMAWTPTFLVEKFHFGLAAAGFSGSAFIFLACAVSAPLGGVIADALARLHPGGRVMVQAAGLLFGAPFVFLVGITPSVATLLISMTLFGVGKGLYDSNIFASLYDVVDARSRSTAAGIMNTVGWGGGAFGPLYVGFFAKHGSSGSEIQNMGHAIAAASMVYLGVAMLLFLVAFVFLPLARSMSTAALL